MKDTIVDYRIRVLNINSREALQRLALSSGQLTIVELIRNQGGITAKELSSIFSWNLTNSSTKLNTLWKKGYLQREKKSTQGTGLEYIYIFWANR